MEYIQFGDGEKNLVILPGIGLSKISLSVSAVEAQFKPYTKDYTVYVFDRKNNLEKGSTVETVARDTVTVMKALELDKVCLYGASYGGMIAQMIALLEPDMVEKMFLASTVSGFNDETLSSLKYWKDNATKDNLPLLIEDMLERIYSKEYIEPSKDALMSFFMNTPEKDLEHFVIQLDSILDFNIYERLNEIKCKVMVAGSRNDKVLSFDLMKKSIDALECEAYIYKDAAHAVYDEDPFFLNIVFNFLNK